MKKRGLFAILLVLCCGQQFGQPKDSVTVVISHVFFCVDSITYRNLFKHEFIPNAFANATESSTKTVTESWTGKYLNGRQSYVEFFAVNDRGSPQLGDKFGDVGLVFKTKKPGDIDKIAQLIRQDNKDASFKVMEYDSRGTMIPFNQNLYLSNPALQETFRPYVEEWTVGFLERVGFNETEIQSGITMERFWEKRRGKQYDKLYDNIERIELILSNEELDYLTETLTYLGFSQRGLRFSNNELEIDCSIQQNREYRVKAIHFTLRSPTEAVTLEISKHLTFKAIGAKASFQFNYPQQTP